jgi:hypothetical protein
MRIPGNNLSNRILGQSVDVKFPYFPVVRGFGMGNDIELGAVRNQFVHVIDFNHVPLDKPHGYGITPFYVLERDIAETTPTVPAG